MLPYANRTKEDLEKEFQEMSERYASCKAKDLKLNMSRGKPSKMQLDVVEDILTMTMTPEDCQVDGVDVRNYGELSGLRCAKEYWADVLGCKPEEVFVGGSSSLTFMYSIISMA